MKQRSIILAGFLLLFVSGIVYLLWHNTPSAPSRERKGLSVYTTAMATTPQMPLWKAFAEKDIKFTPHIQYWKNLNDLRGLLLAGKGDIWVGHVDGFAQAAMRGAPVKLIAVTGWKKFYLLSSLPAIQNFDHIKTLPAKTEIAYAPPHSPGAAILRSMEAHGLPKFSYVPCEPKQLSLEALQNKRNLLLLPEPMVSILLQKAPHLHIVASVEEEYGRITNTAPLLPLAGIAINTNTAKQHPNLESIIDTALKKQAALLENNPEAGIATLPAEFEKVIPRALVLASLTRDIVRVRSAKAEKKEILAYLAMLFPKMKTGAKEWQLPVSFFGGTE